jgi:UPF0755 protein
VRALKILAVLALLAGVAAFFGLRWVDRYMNTPVPLAAPVTFVVAKGSSLSSVARELAQRGALTHPQAFVWSARRQGLAGSIHAGEYQIEPGMTPAALLDRMAKGSVILRELTIVEGSTFRDLRRALDTHPHVSHTLAGADAETVMQRIGAPGVHPEGQFFPDTYRFASGSTDVDILRQANAELRRRLEAAWRDRDPNVPLASDYEALILASIVEKESALPAERARIAGVFVRRLRKGIRLQTDPTVIYGLGETYDGNIRKRDLRADTPYNTYTRAGLPPTPIAMPGEGAIRAAVRPDDSGALYFVATGEPDGSHYFSATLEEHNAAVRRFLARRRALRSQGGS